MQPGQLPPAEVLIVEQLKLKTILKKGHDVTQCSPLTGYVVEASPHHLHALLQFLWDGERGGGHVREGPSASLQKHTGH